jgi:hypothetical protein
MYLGQIKIVDLRHSTWDKEQSKPAEGQYALTDKQYVDYGTKARRPPFYFLWVRYNPADGLRTVRDYKTQWGFSYVTVDDPFWPEGVPLTEGKYLFGDVVLMKCSLITELRRREEAKAMSDAMSMNAYRRFKDQAKAGGVSLREGDEEEIDRLATGMMER